MAKIKPEYKTLIDKAMSGATLTGLEANALRQLARENPEIAALLRTRLGSRGLSSSSSRQTLGVPGVGNLNHRNGGGYSSGHTISPGGFKKSGQDEASYARMQGGITPDAVVRRVNFLKGRENGLMDGKETGEIEFNGRKYSKREIDWIMKRGTSGATLSNAQQAIYDAMTRRENDKVADEAAAAADKKAQEQQRLSWRQDLAKIAARGEETRRTQRELAAYKEKLKRDKEAADLKDFNEKYGIPDGVKLSKKDREDIAAGRKAYDYSPANKQTVDQLQIEMDKVITDPTLTDEEKARMCDAYQEKLDAIPKRVVTKNSDDRTADEIYNGATVIDGQRYLPDGKGGLTRLDNPAEIRQQNAQATDARRKEQADLAARNRRQTSIFNAIQTARRNHAIDQAKAKKDWETAKGDDGELLHGKDDPFKPTDFELKKAYENASADYEASLGADSPSPAPTPAPTTTGALCPICGAPLQPDGTCAECGWPNAENLSQETQVTAAPQPETEDYLGGYGGTVIQ